ncbi:uncharacterized protein HaLaN_11819, partial [Haematococcus lacustris]
MMSPGLSQLLTPAPRYAPEALYASSIVFEVVRELHPDVLQCWAPHAAAIAEAAKAELEGLVAVSQSCIAVGGAGLERSRRALRELQGRAEVVALVQVGALQGEGGSKRSSSTRLGDSGLRPAPGPEEAAEPWLDGGYRVAVRQLVLQLSIHADCVAAAQGGLKASTPVVAARQALAAALAAWVEAGWQPGLVQTLLGVFEPRGLNLELDPADLHPSTAATASTTDMSGSAASGPSAGPGSGTGAGVGSGGASAGGGGLGFVECEGQVRRLLSNAALSESRVMRCALVRLVAKAASLGPSMPTFCVQPLLEPLTAAVKPSSGKHSVEAVRRVLELLVPLAHKPAVKSGLLELRAAGVAARVLHMLFARLAEEATEGAVAVTMTLELLALLLNPQLSMNRGLPLAQRRIQDTPPLQDLTPLVTALLPSLQHLGRDAALVKGLLLTQPSGLGLYAAGRQALRQGAVKWHFSQTGGSGATSMAAALADPAQVQIGLTWAAGRLKEVGE